MSRELETLKVEYEDLKINGNKITSFNKDEYFKKQARLKELPQIIEQLERDKIKAYGDKEEFKSALCKNIHENIGADIKEEYNYNKNILVDAFEEHLINLINIYKELEQLTNNYKNSVSEVLNTRGIYLTLEHDSDLNNIKESHNMGGDRLYLVYAK